MSFLRKRLQDEKGFTLIELLVVVIILGILMAIAIPSYMKFKDKANDSAAQANVRASVPVVEDFASNRSSGYAGMSVASLVALDPGVTHIAVLSSAQTTYCLKSTKGSPDYYKKGPGGAITTTTCS